MDNNSVKKNITALRKSLGFTQQEMAEKLGISRNAYRRIESGETALVNDYLMDIAAILGKTPDELLLGYMPDENAGRILDELRVEYSRRGEEKESEYRAEIDVLNRTVLSLENRISLLEDLVKTKDEIIAMLKKDKQR